MPEGNSVSDGLSCLEPPLFPAPAGAAVPALPGLSVAQGCRGWSCSRIPSWVVGWPRVPAPLATAGRAGCCHSLLGPQPGEDKNSSTLHKEPQVCGQDAVPRPPLMDLPTKENSPGTVQTTVSSPFATLPFPSSFQAVAKRRALSFHLLHSRPLLWLQTGILAGRNHLSILTYLWQHTACLAVH